MPSPEKESFLVNPIVDLSYLYLTFYKCDNLTPYVIIKTKFRTKNSFQTVFFEHLSKMDSITNHVAKNVNSFYGSDTVTANFGFVDSVPFR